MCKQHEPTYTRSPHLALGLGDTYHHNALRPQRAPRAPTRVAKLGLRQPTLFLKNSHAQIRPKVNLRLKGPSGRSYGNSGRLIATAQTS